MRGGRGGRRRALLAAVLALLAAAAVAAPVAAAHESTPEGVQRVELSLGSQPVELTVTLPPEGGGRAAIVLTPRGDGTPGPVTVAAARPGTTPGPATVLATVLATGPATGPATGAAGRTERTTLDLPDPGDWEVVLSAGSGVSETARVPVTVAAVPSVATAVWVFWGALLIGVASLIAAVGPTARARPRVALPLGGLAVAGLTLAVTLVVVDPGGGPTAPAGAPATSPPGGHDHAAMPAVPAAEPAPMVAGAPGAVAVSARASGPAPSAGSPTDLVLDLTDASSGAVLDDLVIHDDALIHLAVIGPDGSLAHVHPVRVAPGRYAVRLTPSSRGRHGVFAEVQRAGGGGHQIARTAVDVAGPAAPPVAAGPPGPREVAGLQADVTLAHAATGRPSGVTVTFSESGRPVGDLQAWLGMAGHLMLLGPGISGAPDPSDPASTFGHVHDMTAAGPAGTYGPQVRFDYAFPREGRYALWVQVQRDRRVLTVPVTVDVGPDTAS